MVKAVMVFVIAVIFLSLSFMLKRSKKKDAEEREKYKKTTATIEQVIYSDTGNARYYVAFTDDGKEITAQTEYYSSETKSLDPGEEVEIGYFYIKGDPSRAMAVIYDDRIIPVSSSIGTILNSFMVIGLVLLVVSVIMVIKEV